MDTTETITHVSLCAGYGGIDLGLKRAIPSLRTVAFSEIEAFACANLVSKMEAGLLDPAPVWTNLKTFPWSEFRDRVDILSGGYPCQPFSAAGKRLGTEDPRHLWPFIADGIRAMRPRLCFFENVEGHISLGLRAVIEELAGIGYETTWGIFSAAEVGAPHQRKRVFILAHRIEPGLEGHAGHGDNRDKPGWLTPQAGGPTGPCGLWPSRPGEPQFEWEPPRVVANAKIAGESIGPQGEWETKFARAGESDEGVDDAERISSGAPWTSCAQATPTIANQHAGQCAGAIAGQAEPTLGGDADGTPGGLDYAQLCVTCDNRTDELRLLGNGVVPAVATKAFITLASELFNLDNATHEHQIR